MKVFSCNFGKGVSATITVPETPPANGEPRGFNVKWTTGKRNHLPPVRAYVGWVNSVNQTLANEWNLTLSHVFQITANPKTWEMWVYKPGGRPQRVMPSKVVS